MLDELRSNFNFILLLIRPSPTTTREWYFLSLFFILKINVQVRIQHPKKFGYHKNNYLLCISKYFMIRNKLIYITNWAMGIAAIFIGAVNIFYGNDAFFGIFLLVLSLIFIPELIKLIQYKFAISIPLWAKLLSLYSSSGQALVSENFLIK